MLKKYGTPSPPPASFSSVDDSLQPHILDALEAYLPPDEILAKYPGLIRWEFLPRGADNGRGARTLLQTLKLSVGVKGCRGFHCLVPKEVGSSKLEMMLNFGFESLLEVRHANVDYHVLGMVVEQISYSNSV